MGAGCAVLLLLLQKQCRGTRQPLPSTAALGNWEQGATAWRGAPEEPCPSHRLPRNHSLPLLVLPALSSPSLHPAQPQELPVSASSSPPRAAATALSALGRHSPALCWGYQGSQTLLDWDKPCSAQHQQLIAQAGLCCAHTETSHLHPQRLSGPAQLPILRHSAAPHPDGKIYSTNCTLQRVCRHKGNFSVSSSICCPSPAASTDRGQSLSQLWPISQKTQQVNPHPQQQTDHPNN